jgi:hypothetical protein
MLKLNGVPYLDKHKIRFRGEGNYYIFATEKSIRNGIQ